MNTYLPEEIKHIILSFMYSYPDALELNLSPNLIKYLKVVAVRRIVNSSQCQNYYVDGVLHSEDDQPATISWDGVKHWYKNDKLHRDTIDENGFVLPACVYPDIPQPHFTGLQIWRKNGVIHRSCKDRDGNLLPAVRYTSLGTIIRQYYIDGTEVIQRI